jgi:hypothetical protein
MATINIYSLLGDHAGGEGNTLVFEGFYASSFVVIFLLIIAEVFFRRYKTRLKKNFTQNTQSLDSLEEIEDLTLDFYQKSQKVDVIRFISFFFGLILLLLIYDIRALSFLAVATGAFILVLKEVLASLVLYPYVLARHQVGDDIRIRGNLGEIVKIKLLSVAFAGKEDTGEFNGKLFYVPNYVFMTEAVEQQELKNHDYRRAHLRTVYVPKDFGMPFGQWLGLLREFLDELLPKRNLDKVGNYKSYAGVRYKLGYDYGEDGELYVDISYVVSPHKAKKVKEDIVLFIESLRKVTN